ncbi:MAG: energy-coupling factor ABC transporter permease [Dethiosulfatibacter sp.]|nr:energy-coupling factor ABC transporter permease [Dethiosulfatibacter sp.]
MSHVHIPDGIIPFYLWLPGYILTFVIIYFVIKRSSNEQIKRVLPFTGIAAALMLIGMSVPLIIIPVHISLAVLTGILIGPKMAFLVVFVVSMILAMFGHGGITIVGLNTLVIGSEVFIGAMLFKKLAKNNLVIGTSIATVIALIVSMSMMVAIIGTYAGFAEVLPHEAVEHVEEEHLDEGDHDDSDLTEAVSEINYLAFSGWVALIMIVVVGVGLETLITVLIIRYFYKVRPDLIETVHGFTT